MLFRSERIVPDTWLVFDTRSVLGGILADENKYAEAESLLLSGYRGMEQREDNLVLEQKRRRRAVLGCLVHLYESAAQPDKAAEWKKKSDTFDQADEKH